jgi:hypothetical protein
LLVDICPFLNGYAEKKQCRTSDKLMTPRLSKFVLTTHIAMSVGWLGAVAAFLVLSIAAVASQDAEAVRGAYVSMNLIGLYVIVPLSFAALLTGIVQSLATHWGLFKHYWVLTKLVLTMGATGLLLMHQFGSVAKVAKIASGIARGVLPDLGQLGTQLVSEASFGLLALLAITTLSVYKPWGRTPYGERKQKQLRQTSAEITEASGALALTGPVNGSNSFPLGLKIFIAITGVLVVIFGALHHGGHSFHHLQ